MPFCSEAIVDLYYIYSKDRFKCKFVVVFYSKDCYYKLGYSSRRAGRSWTLLLKLSNDHTLLSTKITFFSSEYTLLQVIFALVTSRRNVYLTEVIEIGLIYRTAICTDVNQGSSIIVIVQHAKKLLTIQIVFSQTFAKCDTLLQ